MPPNLEQSSNVETPEVTPVEQQAIDDIKKSDGKAVDAKFPDADKTNEALKRWDLNSNDDPKSNEKQEQKEYSESDYNMHLYMVINQIHTVAVWVYDKDHQIMPDKSINLDYVNLYKNIEKQKDLFLHSEPLSVKARLAIENSIIAKSNLKENTQVKLIDIPKFMELFLKEQKIAIVHEREETIKNPTIKFNNIDADQKSGEFIAISIQQQNEIINSFAKMLSNKQEIVSIKLIGRANSVRPASEKTVRDQIEQSQKILITKWFDQELFHKISLERDGTKLNNDDFFSNLNTLSPQEKDNELNKAWAYARALMQIDFLPDNQIKELINKSQNFNISLNPQRVSNNSDIVGPIPDGDQFTWWWLEINTKWSEEVKKITEIDPLKPLNTFIQMHTSLKASESIPNDPEGSSRSLDIGSLSLSFRDGKLEINNYLTPKSWSDIQKKPFDYYISPTEKSGSVTSSNTRWQSLQFDSNIKFDDPRITSIWNNQIILTWVDATPNWFISLLQECSDKSTDPKQKEYISTIIQVINNLVEVNNKKI